MSPFDLPKSILGAPRSIQLRWVLRAWEHSELEEALGKIAQVAHRSHQASRLPEEKQEMEEVLDLINRICEIFDLLPVRPDDTEPYHHQTPGENYVQNQY